jgi:hypothetical protein
VDLARKDPRSEDEEGQLASLKLAMAELVMSSAAGDVYEEVRG